MTGYYPARFVNQNWVSKAELPDAVLYLLNLSRGVGAAIFGIGRQLDNRQHLNSLIHFHSSSTLLMVT